MADKRYTRADQDFVDLIIIIRGTGILGAALLPAVDW